MGDDEMISEHKHFDVNIERSVDVNSLSWPKPGEAMDEGGLGGNRSYIDLRYLSWKKALRVYELEEKYIKRILASSDWDIECEIIEEEEILSDSIGIFGLDIGVASSVCALSAALCIPFSSCNAGAFGGSHNEFYPCVVFYARMEIIDMLLQCAEIAEIGLINKENGCLFLYSDNIVKMRIFANSMIEHRSAFRKLQIHKKNSRVRGPNNLFRKKQMTFEF